MKKSDWWADEKSAKAALDEAREEGIKKGKNEFIGMLYEMPKLKFETKDTKEDEYIEHILTQTRNAILSEVFDMTMEEIHTGVTGYDNKDVSKGKKCCECESKDIECHRICPIECPRYEKPCGG